jgi:hypothetical protein
MEKAMKDGSDGVTTGGNHNQSSGGKFRKPGAEEKIIITQLTDGICYIIRK